MGITRYSKSARRWVSVLAIVMMIAAMSGVASAAPVPGTDVTYTTTSDFAQGNLLNVNSDTPDQLQLNKVAKPFPFVNIANSGRGTAVRINAETGIIIGEYWTAPNGMARNPSRTTVDLLGNVWVTNRDEGSASGGVAKGSLSRIGLVMGGTRVNADGTLNPSGEYLQPPFDYSTCVDRNSDGLIRTSRGLGNILNWGDAAVSDRNGGVTTAADECIINYTRVLGTYARTVAVDSNNDVWVGGANTIHEKLDGTTGQPVAGTSFSKGCGGYGGFMDSKGVLWSSRYGSGLLRYDTNTNFGTCIGFSNGDYGLGVDPVTGHVWQTYLSSGAVAKLNPDGSKVGDYGHGNWYAQGVAVDAKGNVWVAHSLLGPQTTVGHLRTDGTFVGNVALPGGSGPTGLAVDANGKIWVANYNSSNAMRIDPDAGPIGGGGHRVGAVDLTVNLGAGAWPYNYSDMTGFVAFGSTSPQGTWTVVQDGGVLGHKWGTVEWNQEPQGSIPPGTSITVSVRVADDQSLLSGQPFTVVANGVPFSLTGRYIEVQSTLKTTISGTTPVLSDLSVRGSNLPPTVSLAPASTDEATPVALSAAASDPDGDVLTYTWEIVSGGGILTPSGESAVLLHDDGPATVLVRVTVDDGKGGTASAQAEVQINNVAPAVDAGPDQAQFWGLPVSFSGTASDPSSADTAAGLNPAWSFGDGGTALGFAASHTYADPGLYAATLTATDKDGGTGSDSADVAVSKRGTSLSLADSTTTFGTAATLTATLSDSVDAATALLAGRTVVFTAGGETISAVTDAAGVASASAPALLLPGTYPVTAAFAEDSHYLGSNAEATLTVTNTPGKVTAGTLKAANNGRGGFNVQSDGTSVKGELQFQNNAVKFHAPTITALAVSADLKSAWFAGIGTNGVAFVAYVEDNGEPGSADKFLLWVGGVSQNGDGALTGGNIQIH